jgi:hypothetical protein
VSRGRGSRKECIYGSFEEARAEAVKIHGGEEKMLEFVFGVQSEDYEVGSCNRGTRRLRSADVLDEDENLRANVREMPQLGDLELLEDLPKCLALRGCTPFLWLDVKRGWTEEGVWCKGCVPDPKNGRRSRWSGVIQRDWVLAEARVANRAWRNEECVLHVEECLEAQNICADRVIKEGR